jgi:hypothetical protein
MQPKGTIMPKPTDHALPPEHLAPHVPRGDDMTRAGDADLPVFDAGHELLPFPPTDVQPTDNEGNIMPGGDEPDMLTDDGRRAAFDPDTVAQDPPEPKG